MANQSLATLTRSFEDVIGSSLWIFTFQDALPPPRHFYTECFNCSERCEGTGEASCGTVDRESWLQDLFDLDLPRIAMTSRYEHVL